MTLTEQQYIQFEEQYNKDIEEIMKEVEISDVLNNADIDEVMKFARSEEDEMALRVLLNTFNRISGNMAFTKLKYKVLMGGFLIGFNLNKITNKELEEYQDSNKIRIKGCKKGDIEKYWLELSFRRRVMEMIIWEQYDDGWQREMEDKKYD